MRLIKLLTHLYRIVTSRSQGTSHNILPIFFVKTLHDRIIVLACSCLNIAKAVQEDLEKGTRDTENFVIL